MAAEEFICNYFEDANTLNLKPVIFEWAPGTYEINLTAKIQNFEFRKFSLYKVTEPEGYAAYRQKHQNNAQNGRSAVIPIEGERYAVKSVSSLRGRSIDNAALTPYDTYKKKINAIDANSWDKAGQKILWEFTVPASGFYQLAFSYSQSGASNKPVFRRIEIDGAVPFKELACVAFPQNNADSFENLTVEIEDKPAEIWLEAGTHTISMRAGNGAHGRDI